MLNIKLFVVFVLSQKFNFSRIILYYLPVSTSPDIQVSFPARQKLEKHFPFFFIFGFLGRSYCEFACTTKTETVDSLLFTPITDLYTRRKPLDFPWVWITFKY